MQPQEILKKVFGYDRFRPGQAEIVSKLLSGQDVLAVMPTGAGKSLCYQVPALALPGITIVVSPLVSLMKDQVGALVQAGVAAAFLNNSLTDNQKALMLRRAREGWYKIIYVAPERLEMPGFQRFAQEQPISMVTVDEAHCISQWGQDFRPSYLRIRDFVDSLPQRPVVGAFTATATARVREDIRTHLALQAPYEVTASFDRPNLYFSTRRALPSEKPSVLLELVLQEGENSGIVYCSTTRQVDDTTRLLQSRGIRAAAYHAKLEPEVRRKNQDDFLYDRVQVMVATNAFGMGIDKPNVRFVIHYNMPKDLESYYQEAGPVYAAVFRHRCAHHPLFYRKGAGGGQRPAGGCQGRGSPQGGGTAQVHDLLLHYAPLPAGVHPELFWRAGPCPLRQLFLLFGCAGCCRSSVNARRAGQTGPPPPGCGRKRVADRI